MTELPSAAARKFSPDIQEGALLAGRYRIGRLLATGGMGAVFAAQHVELGEPVAIKVLLPEVMTEGSGEAQARFEREAWAASKIKSEYVVRVIDVGRLVNGTPFIVMEYLDGVDLSDVLRQHGPLEIEQAVELVLQACEALAEAHALGIYHRDLKPSNLFCVRRSDGLLAIKLLDFGISKLARAHGGDVELRLTATAATLGTPLYMAPEQMRSGKLADERSDIWSLGVILYELSTGELPYTAESLAELAVKIATERPVAMRTRRRAVPAGLDSIVTRCLAKDSAGRYHDVAELARALVSFGPPRSAAHAERAQRIVQVSRQRSTPALHAPPGPSVAASQSSHARMRGLDPTLVLTGRVRSRLVLPLLLAVLVVAGALAVRWFWPKPKPPAADSGKPPAHQERSAQPTDPAVVTLPPSAAEEAPAPVAPKPPSPPRRRVAKPAPRVNRPVTPQSETPSELDSLGGRL